MDTGVVYLIAFDLIAFGVASSKPGSSQDPQAKTVGERTIGILLGVTILFFRGAGLAIGTPIPAS